MASLALRALALWPRVFLRRPIQGERGRRLMEPGGRDGIHRQGMERDCSTHTVEIGGKQGIEALPEPLSTERGARQARLAQG